MHHAHADRPFPRGPLIAAACLITIAIVAAATARLTGIGVTQLPPAGVVEMRELTFADRADGAVVVREATTGREILIVDPGTNGFLRGVMRGLARDRKLARIGAEPPFRLTRYDNGVLVLDDPSTGRRIGLDAFGPTNAGVFARLLPSGGPK